MERIRLIAVGDSLMHKQVYDSGKKEGGYDFTGIYDPVISLIKDADIRMINQETILVSDPSQVSSFPAFGTPKEAALAIVEAGFNVVTQASNHALDKHYKGILTNLSVWDAYKDKVLVTGIQKSAEDRKRIPIMNVKGKKIAILNYTEKLNFHLRPLNALYCVNVMKPYSKRSIKEQISEAKRIADIVIVCPHWGTEYLLKPEKSQNEWGRFFAESGADLIIGTHPHVVRPMETIICQDGRKVPCMYSLGNFLACQVVSGTQLGAMADVTISFDETGKLDFKTQLIPLVVDTDESYSYFKVYPLMEYTDEKIARNRIMKIQSQKLGKQITIAYLREMFDAILAGNADEYTCFYKPFDVTWANIKGVTYALLGINKK